MFFKKFRLKDLDYYKKWTLFGLLIGIISGIGAALFYYSTEFAENLFMTHIMGYTRPLPLSESVTSFYHFMSPLITPIIINRMYLIPISIILGALVSAFLVYRFAPETEGHGTDAVIKAFHKDHGKIRLRVSLIKFLSASITIGSGGSAGREGPIAQIAASLVSSFSRHLHISERDKQIMSAVAIGSALGSIFKSPFGGAIFGAEVLYKRDFEGDVIYPSFIASAVGFMLYGALTNFTPLFGINILSAHALSMIFNPIVILGFVVLGIVSGIFAKIYIKVFYYVNRKFKAMKVSRYFKPAIGAIGTAAIALAFPEIMGVGYGWVQLIIHGNFSAMPMFGLPLVLFVFVLIFAKILATSFSIGSGGSGGVYAPGMFIGASVGVFTLLILQFFIPSIFTAEIMIPFVIIGMLSVFGAASKAPIAVAIMVIEMTGNISIIPVAMLSIGLAYVLTGSSTIYISQKEKRK